MDHSFDNLIALCPNCHTRFDRGEIDRKSMLQYKANLALLNGRYGDLERPILYLFDQNPKLNVVRLPELLEILISYFLMDGLLARMSVASGVSVEGSAGEVELTPRLYALTDRG
jgi:HNH endonuclease